MVNLPYSCSRDIDHLKFYTLISIFLDKQGGEMLYVRSVGLTNNIFIPTESCPFFKQQIHMQEEQTL